MSTVEIHYSSRYKDGDKQHRSELLEYVRTTHSAQIYNTVEEMIMGFNTESKNSEKKMAAMSEQVKKDIKEVGWKHPT